MTKTKTLPPSVRNQRVIAAEGHRGRIDATDTHGDMTAAQERGEQVPRLRGRARIPGRADRFAKFGVRCKPESAEAARFGHSGGEFGTRRPPPIPA